MKHETFYPSLYNGTKKFTQHEIINVNATGFVAATDDFAERGIDLNEKLIMNKPSTFFYKMNDASMEGFGLFADDVLIIDRSIKVFNRKIIVASVNGELFVRQFIQSFNKVKLCASNKKHNDIVLDEYSQFQSLGVVTCVLHLIDETLINFFNNEIY